MHVCSWALGLQSFRWHALFSCGLFWQWTLLYHCTAIGSYMFCENYGTSAAIGLTVIQIRLGFFILSLFYFSMLPNASFRTPKHTPYIMRRRFSIWPPRFLSTRSLFEFALFSSNMWRAELTSTNLGMRRSFDMT